MLLTEMVPPWFAVLLPGYSGIGCSLAVPQSSVVKVVHHWEWARMLVWKRKRVRVSEVLASQDK
jgi:hypothetical protein